MILTELQKVFDTLDHTILFKMMECFSLKLQLLNGLDHTWRGFYVSNFLQRISPKIQFLHCLLSSIAPWGCPMFNNEGKFFWNLGLQIIEKCNLDFSWDFRVSWGVFKKSWLERYIQTSFMCVCKYLNQRARIIGE